MSHVFKHPNYYKQLKDKLPRGNLSPEAEATSDKPQASSVKQQAIEEMVPHCDIEEAATINRINKKEENE